MERTAARLILRARHRRGWSQAELARQVGIPAPQLCAYERATRQPSAAMLARILSAAGMGLALVDPGEESRRQADELVDVLGLVDAMPLRPPARTMSHRSFRELINR